MNSVTLKFFFRRTLQAVSFNRYFLPLHCSRNASGTQRKKGKYKYGQYIMV